MAAKVRRAALDAAYASAVTATRVSEAAAAITAAAPAWQARTFDHPSDDGHGDDNDHDYFHVVNVPVNWGTN